MQLPIYLDHNATTPTDKRVVAAMYPYFTEHFGNPASQHWYGEIAALAVESARTAVAELLGAGPREIVFTSGATESNNLALKGTLAALAQRGNHLITMPTEHEAVLDPCRLLAERGAAVTFVPVDRAGQVDPQTVADAITDRTILVSVMLANNETGTIQPLAEIAAICKRAGVWLHTDATQAIGRLPVNVQELGVDLLSFSGHKFYGPKGIGGLYVRNQAPRVRLVPLQDGGGHERGRRSGTLAVPLIVGLGVACQLAAADLVEGVPERLRHWRDHLEQRLLQALPSVQINGALTRRLPNTSNLAFAGLKGETLQLALRERLALSLGSACSSASAEPSHVLMAMGLDEADAHASIRLSLGRQNTFEEVEAAATMLIEMVPKLRAHASS